MLAALSRRLRLIARLALYVSASGIVVMTAIIGWQVFARYVLNDTPHWSERLSIFLMNWYILLAAAVGVHERFHIGLVFFKEALPRAARFVAEAIIHLSVGGFAVAMIVHGADLAEKTWSHVIPTLGIGVGWGYLPFPLAGALMVIFSADHLARLFLRGPDADAPDGDAPETAP